jgi:uncharacterized protein (TIGR02246 family)
MSISFEDPEFRETLDVRLSVESNDKSWLSWIWGRNIFNTCYRNWKLDEETIMAKSTLEERVSRIEDIEAIKTLINTYHWRVDQFDWIGWAQCFTADAVFEMPNLFGTLRGRDEIQSTCQGKMDHVYDEIQHVIVNVHVELTGPDTATGHGNLIFNAVENREQPRNVDSTGARYTWKFRQESDGWRIEHSTCIFLWNNGASGSSIFRDRRP